jgi:hypothetical protein
LVKTAKSSRLTSTSDRRRAGRRLHPAAALAQRHGDAALDVIADQEIVRRADRQAFGVGGTKGKLATVIPL